MEKDEDFCRKMVSLAKSLAKNPKNDEVLPLVLISVSRILNNDKIQELLEDLIMEEVLDHFFNGKYSKALNEAAKYREKIVALEHKITKERAEKAALAAEIAALKDKAAFAEEKIAFAEEKCAFAKEKDKILINKLYNDNVELDTISHSFGLSIDEIKKIISNK